MCGSVYRHPARAQTCAQMRDYCRQCECYRFWVWVLRSGNICWAIKKDNTFVYVFFTAAFSNTTSPCGLPSSNHNCSSTISTFTWPRLGQGNLAPRTIYTVPCLWMDLVILIFFFCAYALCLHCEDSWKKREREREGGKKTSLTEAQSIISQVFDWSDCKRSRRFPRALDWDELELVRNKTQFSRSEETAVLNKTRQRMQKKRLPCRR